jgi:esterase/lipase
MSVGILYPTATSDDMVLVSAVALKEEDDVVALAMGGDVAAVVAKEMKAGDLVAVTTMAPRETRASVRRGVKRVNERAMIMVLEDGTNVCAAELCYLATGV